MGREWGKRRREFVCFSASQCWLGTVVRHSRLVYTYKGVVCVCWFVCLFVCLLFIGHTTLSTLRRCLRVAERAGAAVAGGPARRAGKRMHMQREHARAHAVQLINEKFAALMPFKNKTVPARACCRIRNCRDFPKERENENQHATSQVQFTVCLLLECLLFESY